MNDKPRMIRLLQDVSIKLKLDAQAEVHQDEIEALHLAHNKQLLAAQRVAELAAENTLLRQALERSPSVEAPEVAPAPDRGAKPRPDGSGVTLGQVVETFLGAPHQHKKASMFKKHQTVLPLLIESVGAKMRVEDLRQSDINKFFDVVQRLPPRWSDECRRRKISPVVLAGEPHPVTLGPGTFVDTYLACMRTFLKSARRDWQDRGFPTNLTTEGVEYVGDRKEGESKQRAFRKPELERLFFGPELKSFRTDPALEHQFWLPAIGLLTGARVNEIAQINPASDVLQETESGIWYLSITEDTETDERVTKSTKNKASQRKVPIHLGLIDLGFLGYVERMQEAGALLLFPRWNPSRGKASGAAEKWFRQLLTDMGLRDETPGSQLVGMHAFRHTLLTSARNTLPPVDATSITGHVGTRDAVLRGYEGDLSLPNKQRLLQAIDFGVSLYAASYKQTP